MTDYSLFSGPSSSGIGLKAPVAAATTASAGGSLLSGASSVLGSINPYLALGTAAMGAARPAGPSSVVDTGGYDWMFDSSGWNVNFGSGGITSQATKTESDPLGLAGLGSGLSMNWGTVAVIGLGVAAIWAILRR